MGEGYEEMTIGNCKVRAHYTYTGLTKQKAEAFNKTLAKSMYETWERRQRNGQQSSNNVE